MKRILLIGQGQIGSELLSGLSDHTVEVWRDDIEGVRSEILAEYAPDVVINAAGKTDLAWCESNAREAFRSNVEAPVGLYRRILEHSGTTRFIHFSSGCVWDGPYDSTGQPFTPEHPATPAAYYSWTKVSADLMLRELNAARVSILRPRQVFSSTASPRNTLVKLLRYPRLIDTANSMSSARTIVRMVEHCIVAADWSGIWNVYDTGVVTPYEVGVLLAEAGLRDIPQRLTKDELDEFHKPRRVDTVLYDERFERTIQPGDVRDELQSAILGLKDKL